MFDAYWKDNIDISNEETLIILLEKCNIEKKIFLEGIKNQKIKDKLKLFTQKAYNKEIFGVPTFLVDNKVFWGQDRLEFALDEFNK